MKKSKKERRSPMSKDRDRFPLSDFLYFFLFFPQLLQIEPKNRLAPLLVALRGERKTSISLGDQSDRQVELYK